MYLTENRLSRNEMWYVADDHNYMRQIYSKEFLDSNFYQSVIDTWHQNFTNPQKS